MAYGQWIIYQNDSPKYYFDIFDPMYKELDTFINDSPSKYLEKKFKLEKKGYSFTQRIHGRWSSEIKDQWFDLEKLPISFFF